MKECLLVHNGVNYYLKDTVNLGVMRRYIRRILEGTVSGGSEYDLMLADYRRDPDKFHFEGYKSRFKALIEVKSRGLQEWGFEVPVGYLETTLEDWLVSRIEKIVEVRGLDWFVGMLEKMEES